MELVILAAIGMSVLFILWMILKSDPYESPRSAAVAISTFGERRELVHRVEQPLVNAGIPRQAAIEKKVIDSRASKTYSSPSSKSSGTSRSNNNDDSSWTTPSYGWGW